MRKLLRTLIAILLIASFIYMGYFLDQECHHKYPDWLPNYMYEVYDVVYSIDVKIVPEDPNKDVWQETKVTLRKGGDCEDWAIVVGKKLADLGYTVEPVGCRINVWGTRCLHMWVRVHIMSGCCRYDSWDIDMIVEPRIFPARLQYEWGKEDIDKYWDMILGEE